MGEGHICLVFGVNQKRPQSHFISTLNLDRKRNVSLTTFLLFLDYTDVSVPFLEVATT